ncbi:MAG: hypothetical protein A2147_07405 [Chloroflexi bacterium RBG_16_57_8]|nr:MAG: hypothetical protein A2147_07405 [Chloroflexi bacterium RBG_16_57_8]
MNEQQLEKDLKAIAGERVTVSRHERWFYQRDLVTMPRWVTRLVKAVPDAVVSPADTAEVSAVLRYCNDNAIPVTPRGAGSSGLFGAVPKKAGVVLDLRGLAQNVAVNAYNERVECQGAGVTWWELDRRLRRDGVTLMSYPSSARSATIAGWLMTTGMGIGNIKYGPVHAQVLSAEIVMPDGTIKEYTSGKDLDCFMASEGLLGIVTQACLKVRPVPDSNSHHLVYFRGVGDLFEFLAALLQTNPLPYAVEFFDDNYLRLLKTGGYPATDFGQSSGLALITYDGSRAEVDESKQSMRRLTAEHSGEEREGAEEEWRQRFNMLRVRRAVPSLIPASVDIPMAKIGRFYSAMSKMKKRPIALLGHVISKNDCVLMPMTASDENAGLEYAFALHTPVALSDLALSLGGKPAGGLGLWNAAYRNAAPMKARAQEIEAKKKELDPKGILNPGMWPDPPSLLKPVMFRTAISLASFADRIMPTQVGPVTTKDTEKEFTDCVQCGYCMGYCPTRQQFVSSTPRGRILAARELLIPAAKAGRELEREMVGDIFECTLCGRCRTDCSVEVKSPEMWADLRSQVVKAGGGLDSLKTLSGSIEGTHNLAAKPNEQRAKWADTLKLAHRKQTAETVYFVGCVTSFYPMVQDVARSFAQILNKTETDFTILGGEEWCCGYPLMSAGYTDSAVRHMEHNIERVTRIGAKRIVMTCPGCYRMWKHDYHRMTGKEAPVEVLHSTELLAKTAEQGNITFGELNTSVTYHDPCDLGRNAGLYDEPRYIIGKVPGLEFKEIEPNRQYTNCCGSGGDLLASNQALSLDIAGRKVDEILDTGAASVITACPSCIRGITMAKVARKAPFTVLDIAQLVWKAMVK